MDMLQCREPWFCPLHRIKLGMMARAGNPETQRRWRQKDHRFKVTFGYIEELRPGWIYEILSQNKAKQNPKKIDRRVTGDRMEVLTALGTTELCLSGFKASRA